MKRILTFLLALALPLTLLAQTPQEDYVRRYNNLVSRVGPAGVGVETLLDRWAEEYPDDTQQLLARFSLFKADLPVPPPDPYPCFDLDRETALQYLHGDAIRIPDAPLGLLTLTYQGHPLGPGKNLGSRCNNLYPKDRRIRMDIR